jgi:two-component system, OmpR family, sensor histidine kinase BaeS
MTEVVEIVTGWPLAVSLAAAITVRGLQAGRRRTVLNEALHELRRPLHSIALATGTAGTPRVVESSVQLATVALERLDREINGGSGQVAMEVVAARPLLGTAVNRWKGRAALAGGSMALRWRAGGAMLEVDRLGLAQALDNLIVNAIEHGGPAILVEASRRGGFLRIGIVDSGRASRPISRRETPAELVARLSGRRRRGHGLAVVRRVAAEHGGSFSLRRSRYGSHAALELPLIADPTGPPR